MSSGIGVSAEIQAASQLGNDGSLYERYWNTGSEAWCALFAAWAVDTCAVGAKNHTCPWSAHGGVAWSGAVLSWGESTGKALPAGAAPLTGDFYIVDGNMHVGLIRGASGSQMLTVNGNWGQPGRVREQTWLHQDGDVWSDGTPHHIRFVRW
jgi:hypothetical protein